jgi:hypothetical protein
MYNLKADVYTFGILMWEVLSLKKPYAFTRSMAALVDHVGKSTVSGHSMHTSTLFLSDFDM